MVVLKKHEIRYVVADMQYSIHTNAELSLEPGSWVWRLPPCIQLAIATYVPSPIDLYVYVCRAYAVY